MADWQLLFSDVERAIRTRDPQLAEMVIAYVQQDDPSPGRPEVDERAEGEGEAPDPGPDQWTLPRLMQAIAPAKLAASGLTGTEQKVARREAWEGLLAAPNPPPRLLLGKLLIDLYEAGDEPARSSLVEIFAKVRLSWGVWQAAKRIYKLAEERHDAALFGVLGYRFDTLSTQHNYDSSEIGPGTALYLRRRAWRYLRHLGQALPQVYPEFAAQVLAHYPESYRIAQSWVAGQVWGHKRLIGKTGRLGGGSAPSDLALRAFPEAWKVSPSPLLRLIEDAQHADVSGFAIRCLKKDFPDVLRRPEPAWLARLGAKRLETVDELIVEILKTSPEFHQSKLRELGLHATVLGLLRSQSEDARTYAIDYARAHAPDITVADLLGLLDSDEDDVTKFALERLRSLSARDLGLRALARLLDEDQAIEWAKKGLREIFRAGDFDADTFGFFYRVDQRREVVLALFAEAKAVVPAAWLLPIAADENVRWRTREAALEELGKRTAREIGLDWIKRHIDKSETENAIKEWLGAGMCKGDDLDVEWLKGLVLRPRHQEFALGVLGQRELVAASRLGLAWLLEMARRPEEAIRGFAQGALLEAFAPADFAPGRSLDEGIDRVFELAAGPNQPEAVRAFAATYLKVHHPDLNASTPDARQFAVKPKLGHEAYSAARVRALLDDNRVDVRRLGVALAKQEVLRWGDSSVVYAMAASRLAETRTAGCELLLGVAADGAGSDGNDGRLPVSWLDAARVFALAESPNKVSRETALTLIQRHYARLGSPERLGYLMESPEREVQLFAVRLLWERHRPRATPSGWTPPKAVVGLPTVAEAFDSDEVLRQFLRALLFGLPPGRLERRDLPSGGKRGDGPARSLPASVAKRRAVEIARDLAVEDADFSRVVVPVLEEFLGSQAKGEWHACVAALAMIRRAHPDVTVALPPAISAPRRRAVEKSR